MGLELSRHGNDVIAEEHVIQEHCRPILPEILNHSVPPFGENTETGIAYRGAPSRTADSLEYSVRPPHVDPPVKEVGMAFSDQRGNARIQDVAYGECVGVKCGMAAAKVN